MQAEQMSSKLDLVLLDDYLDRLGKVIVEKMFTLYTQQVVIYLNDIENAQLSESSTDWQTHCHKMKGAAASVGMSQLHAQLKVLEKTDASTAEKAVLLTELKVLNEDAIFTFKNWLASK
ncbi:Hpt domain-containing protein [Colwellia echini]|nr:Hpt domain-containing protein [Colwellia echini]